MATNHSLTIVLLCSGNGADPSAYRPSRDDIRYRYRHDALVRCLAASLYGPAGRCSPSELILLYDGDLSCMRMELSPGSMPHPPLERDVVQSWKDAAKSAVRNKQHNATAGNVGTISTQMKSSSAHVQNSSDIAEMKTVCELDMWKKLDEKKSNEAKHNQEKRYSKEPINMKKLPSQMPSAKRDILTVLQSTCSMEYLRQHHLNSSIDVVLRKANKTKLQNAWEGYTKYCSVQKAGLKNTLPKRKTDDIANNLNDSCKHDEDWHRIEMTFRFILSKADDPGSIIAASLHESSDGELPCWGCDNLNKDMNGPSHVFLFLGAVRDMTTAENEALSAACKTLSITLVPCRLGPVPEFTSKIISVAGFHHSKGVLGNGLLELSKRYYHQDRAEFPPKRRKVESKITGPLPKRAIHNIAIVPMTSASLTTDPDHRDRIHWCMVRMTVCSLWRSKLASNPNDGFVPLNNALTFIFLDGTSMTLKQKDFTSAMAENHQAAPSEYQILEQLCRQRDSAAIYIDNSLKNENRSELKKSCTTLIESFVSGGDKGKQFAMNILSNKQTPTSLFDLAYSNEYHQCALSGYTLFTIQVIGHNSDAKSSSDKKVARIRKYIMKTLKSARVVTVDHPSLASCQEEEASTIIMIQHLDYQRLLLPLLMEYDKTGKPNKS